MRTLSEKSGERLFLCEILADPVGDYVKNRANEEKTRNQSQKFREKMSKRGKTRKQSRKFREKMSNREIITKKLSRNGREWFESSCA